MNHTYQITEQVYQWILLGKKTIELRLYNKKAQKINIGDYINFIVETSPNKRIKVQVQALFRYPNIEDLLKDFDIHMIIGEVYTKEYLEELFTKIYKKKQIALYDILGIKFKIVEEQEWLIEQKIDKTPYIKELTSDQVINVTGESGSGKSTYCKKYFSSKEYIYIDTDLIFGEQEVNGIEKYLRKIMKEEYFDHYKEALYQDFDKVYQMILDYLKNSRKIIVIDSAQFRNLKDFSLLKGKVIVMRTGIDTCYQRCITRFKKKNKNSTKDEILEYEVRKKHIYIWYHALNNFLKGIDRL